MSSLPRSTAGSFAIPQQSPLWLAKRRALNGLMWGGTILATLLAVIPLVIVLYYIVRQGSSSLNIAFFTQVQKPADESGGGMLHAIIGSLILVGLASCIGLPVGLLGGIYLAEFGNNRFAWWARFAADVLNGVPSIVIGIFIYAVAVVPFGHFSAYAGGLALGIMMVPTIMRTTEELVRLVPMSLREAALALGATRWRAVFKIVLAAARGGIITGILLAIARIAGETAPLLFTVLGNNFMSTDLSRPIAAMPVTIFNFATSASDEWHRQAWAGALVLVSMIFVLSLAARYFTRGQYQSVK